MYQEAIEIRIDSRQNLPLTREDVFDKSETSYGFTNLGSHLYGLFVVHKQAVQEANGNGVSKDRLEQLMEEKEQKYVIIEEIWRRSIPRDEVTSNYLTRKVLDIVREQEILVSNS